MMTPAPTENPNSINSESSTISASLTQDPSTPLSLRSGRGMFQLDNNRLNNDRSSGFQHPNTNKKAPAEFSEGFSFYSSKRSTKYFGCDVGE